jgi:hypothetical protein
MRCPAGPFSLIDDDFIEKAGFGRVLRDERGGRAFVNRAASVAALRASIPHAKATHPPLFAALAIAHFSDGRIGDDAVRPDPIPLPVFRQRTLAVLENMRSGRLSHFVRR